MIVASFERFKPTQQYKKTNNILFSSRRNDVVVKSLLNCIRKLTFLFFYFSTIRNDVKGPPISETLDEDEEILGSDDDEQEDPRDYTKGNSKLIIPSHLIPYSFFSFLVSRFARFAACMTCYSSSL